MWKYYHVSFTKVPNHIPAQSGQAFQSKADSHSFLFLTLLPIQKLVFIVLKNLICFFKPQSFAEFCGFYYVSL